MTIFGRLTDATPAPGGTLNTTSAVVGENESVVDFPVFEFRKGGNLPINDGYKIVEVPAELRKSVDVPSWLNSWDDVSYMAPEHMYSDAPLLSDSDDDQVRAAAWLYSMSNGRWIRANNSLEIFKRDGVDYQSMILDYYMNGPEV